MERSSGRPIYQNIEHLQTDGSFATFSSLSGAVIGVGMARRPGLTFDLGSALGLESRLERVNSMRV